MTLAQQFYQRFTGLPRAHGHYRSDGVERASDGKHGGFAETVHAPVTPELFDGHLQGLYGVGVVPILDDGTCWWGAIDVDIDKRPELQMVAADVRRMELPLIPCRSKSGGVHLYLFCSEAVPATLVRAKLMEWSVALGYSGVEVFPKQVRLAGPRDFGNWINLPYFSAATKSGTARYAVRADGTQLTAEEFLALATTLAVTAQELHEMAAPSDLNFGDLLHEAPPCLQCIAAKGGAGDGNSNKMMFNVGVYLRKRHGDLWDGEFDQYNKEPFINTPRGHKEMIGLTRSVNRKSYEYTCNEPPLAQVCNRQICLTRKHGIGSGNEEDPGVVFGSLRKIDTQPPAWIWDVDGARIELTTEQLKDQGRFHTACIEVLNKWPAPMKPAAWSNLIRDKLASVEVVPAPPDASPEGSMWQHLQHYTLGYTKARTRDELLDGRPWMPSDEDATRYGKEVVTGRVYFRASDFKHYLESQRMGAVTERRLWTWLRERGAEHHKFNINGRMCACWSIPAFPAPEPTTETLTDADF
jgi:hypothetical protein